MKMLGTRGLVVAAMAAVAWGHAWIEEPGSRVYECRTENGGPRNKNCRVNGKGYSALQQTGRYPESGPVDGVIASAGLWEYKFLDEQSSTRWWKNPMKPGKNTFKWFLWAHHATRDWRYYITKKGWNPDEPLTLRSFEDTPFCTKNWENRETPYGIMSHECDVPDRDGYHVILSLWDTSNTRRAFYQVIDVDMNGRGGGGDGKRTPVPSNNRYKGKGGGMKNSDFARPSYEQKRPEEAKGVASGTEYHFGPFSGGNGRFREQGGRVGMGSPIKWTPMVADYHRRLFNVKANGDGGDCWTVPSGASDGAPVDLAKCKGYVATQEFEFTNKGNGRYQVRSESSKKCVEVRGGQVQVHTCNGGRDQELAMYAWGGNHRYNAPNPPAGPSRGGGGGGGGPAPKPDPPAKAYKPGVRIEAEDYLRMSGVQTERTTDNRGGENVGHIDRNDWMEYALQVPAAGDYEFSFRVASRNGGAKFALELGRQDVVVVPVSSTGGWQDWTTLTAKGRLPAGKHTVRLVSEDGGGFNINWFRFEAAAANPPKPKPQECPRIQWAIFCQDSASCCPAGQQCHAYDSQYSICFDYCPHGWECNKQQNKKKCQEYQGYKLCKGNEGCCPAGEQCFAYNDDASACFAQCPPGWQCN